ncbi:MAG: DUF1499 domain-containing protein [Alphaproteobacteria bacterium]
MAGRSDLRFGGKVAVGGFLLGIVAAVLAAGSGLGNRFGFWTYREGFSALEWIVYVGAAAAVVSLVGAALSWKGARIALVLALVGLVLGAAVAWIPYKTRMALRESPRLADITTDTTNPPAFVAMIPVRKKARARNSTDYSSEKAALQAKHYPDIKPVIVPLPAAAAFDKALAAVKGAGLRVIATDKAVGRIEATATTFWFGFKDDVVVRVSPGPDGSGSKVDIRSTSRVGSREAGTNAARVRKIAAAIAAK